MQVKSDGNCSTQEKITLTHKQVMNISIIYEIHLLTFTVAQEFILGNTLFGAAKLTTNAGPDKCKYSGYGSVFDASGSMLWSYDSGFGKNAIIFGAHMISSVIIDNKKKDILIIRKDPMQRLVNTTLITEK